MEGYNNWGKTWVPRAPEPGGRAGLNPSIAHGREIFPSATSSHTQLPYGWLYWPRLLSFGQNRPMIDFQFGNWKMVKNCISFKEISHFHRDRPHTLHFLYVNPTNDRFSNRKLPLHHGFYRAQSISFKEISQFGQDRPHGFISFKENRQMFDFERGSENPQVVVGANRRG